MKDTTLCDFCRNTAQRTGKNEQGLRVYACKEHVSKIVMGSQRLMPYAPGPIPVVENELY